MRVEIEADTETPVSAFLKLSRGKRQAFLLESVEGGERSGRFSFLGAGPRSSMSWRLGQPGDPIELDPARALRAPGGAHPRHPALLRVAWWASSPTTR